MLVIIKTMLITLCFVLVYFVTLEAATGFNSNPSPVSIHENNDARLAVWSSISATCTESYTCYEDCNPYLCLSSIICYDRCQITCYRDATCTDCSVTDSSYEMSGLSVYKKTCATPGCEPCSADGCLNYGTNPSVTVTCWHSSNPGDTIYEALSITVTQNASPTFSFSEGSSINVYKSSTNTNDVINTIDASDTDAHYDGDSIIYTQTSGPGGSWNHGNTLFALNTGTGEIYVYQSLASEFSWTYSMTLCVHDRRVDTTCNDLSITLYACYQTPTCTDQTSTIADTYSSFTNGHGGDSDILFTMFVPNATDHFPDFSTTWQGLQFTMISQTLPGATIDFNSGVLSATANISVFPSYPSHTFNFVVEVGNSESCYTTTCSHSLTVNFTNWDIQFEKLPYTKNIDEDHDDLKHYPIDIYDYNYEDQDNVTCTLDSISPHEDNLFELINRRNEYSRTSWKIRKMACQAAGCGYKYQSPNAVDSPVPYQCAQNIGCFTHNITQQYVLTITCHDAYGSSVTSTATINIVKNEAPVYINLPSNVTLDSNALSHLDTIFSILYSDNEGESLNIEYTWLPQDYGYFLGTTTGNYYNSLGNITTTTFFHNITVNSTFYVTINAHERRNEIEETFTINIQDYCGETPSCNGATTTVASDLAVGSTLFTISANSPSNGVAYTGLSYSFASSHSAYFSISAGGVISTAKALDNIYPSTSYSINGYVYDSSACAFGHCLFTLIATHVNQLLTITNLDFTVSIHEDTTSASDVFTVMTSDNSTDDSVTCVITTLSPATVAGEVALFSIQESFSGSNVYTIRSRDSPGFTTATLTYSINVTCNDLYGSSDSGVLTVLIEPNDAPTITNLPHSLTADPASLASETTLFTITTSDTENDVITFGCTVDNTLNPLECGSGTGTVKLRRTVDHITENGDVHTMDIVISDAKHPNAASGTLTVTFTSTRTNPEINNIAAGASVSFDEDTSIGTTIITLGVTDPDVNDVHIFSITTTSSKFYLNTGTGVVSTVNFFNYEFETFYILTFDVKDQYLNALEKKDLNVTITNVNEAPTLTVTATSLTVDENEEVGTLLEYPGCECTDPDIGDTLTYSIASSTHSAYFSINSTTGVLSVAQVWDLEAGLSTSTVLYVVCTDAGTLTSSVAVNIQVNNVNEYAPTCSVTYPNGGTFLSLYTNTTVLTNLISIVAIDQDSGDDGSFAVSLLGVGNGGIYFVIYSETVTARRKRSTYTQFSLRLAQKISLTNDKNFTFTIKVSDGEASEQYFGVPVEARYIADPPSGPEPATAECLTCTNNGKILVTLMSIEGVIAIALVLHLFAHFCCPKSKVKVDAIHLIPMSINKRLARSSHTPRDASSMPPVNTIPDKPKAGQSLRPVSGSQIGIIMRPNDTTPGIRQHTANRPQQSAALGKSSARSSRRVATNSRLWIIEIREEISSSSSSDDDSDSSSDDHVTQGSASQSHSRLPKHARAPTSSTTGLPAAIDARNVRNMYPKGF